MNMKKCDRCGQIFDEKGRNHNKITFGKDSVWRPLPDISYDLCPDCIGRIKNFINDDGAKEI